jgi:hypothetical protein
MTAASVGERRRNRDEMKSSLGGNFHEFSIFIKLMLMSDLKRLKNCFRRKFVFLMRFQGKVEYWERLKGK